MKPEVVTPRLELDTEIEAGKVLLQLLQREQELLVKADLEGVSELTETKSKAVAHMNQLALQRSRALAAAGVDATPAGLEQWFAKAAGAAIGNAWNALLDIARQAKELNRTNGLLISQHLARSQAALNVLQGGSNGGTMYGPNGQSTSSSASRRLVIG